WLWFRKVRCYRGTPGKTQTDVLSEPDRGGWASRQAQGNRAGFGYQGVRRWDPGLGVYESQGARRDSREEPAMSGVHGQTSLPLYGRTHGHSSRPARAPRGGGGVSKVGLSIPGTDGGFGEIEGIRGHEEASQCRR